MSTPSLETGAASVPAGAIGDHGALFLTEGIALLILGLLAILVPILASVIATVFFGSLLLVSGALGLFSTLRARKTRRSAVVADSRPALSICPGKRRRLVRLATSVVARAGTDNLDGS